MVRREVVKKMKHNGKFDEKFVCFYLLFLGSHSYIHTQAHKQEHIHTSIHTSTHTHNHSHTSTLTHANAVIRV